LKYGTTSYTFVSSTSRNGSVDLCSLLIIQPKETMQTKSATPVITSSRLVLKKERLVNLSSLNNGKKQPDITTMSSFLY